MVRLSVHGIAKGGDGVAREPSGRVVFIRGALPGDSVDVEIVEEKKRFARGALLEVITAGSGRVDPTCRHVADGCGGCDFQHAALDLQRKLKTNIVADALERIGRFPDPSVWFAGGIERDAYRTTVRCAVAHSKAAFREHGSTQLVPAPECTIAHPRIRALMAEGDFASASEVLIRVGSRTGDCSVVVWPNSEDVVVPFGEVLGADLLDAGGSLFIHEEIAGRRWRVSAQSFLQSAPESAELVVAEVQRQIDAGNGAGILCDLYAGIGLFAGALTYDGQGVAVEANRHAVADARENLSDTDVVVVGSSVERWQPRPAGIVVADPPRAGLGAAGVAAVGGTGATTVILVHCDAAALARDARLMVDSGHQLEDVAVLDLFPQTSHVETVSRFSR